MASSARSSSTSWLGKSSLLPASVQFADRDLAEVGRSHRELAVAVLAEDVGVHVRSRWMPHAGDAPAEADVVEHGARREDAARGQARDLMRDDREHVARLVTRT